MPFRGVFLYSFAAIDKISTDIARRAVSEIAQHLVRPTDHYWYR